MPGFLENFNPPNLPQAGLNQTFDADGNVVASEVYTPDAEKISRAKIRAYAKQVMQHANLGTVPTITTLAEAKTVIEQLWDELDLTQKAVKSLVYYLRQKIDFEPGSEEEQP